MLPIELTHKRVASVLGAMIGMLVLASAPDVRVADAIEVRVRAQSALSGDVTTAGTTVRVAGSLRDEINHGLAQRRIQVRFTQLSKTNSSSARASEPLTETLYTDRRGGFSTYRELDPGRWRVEIRFDETEHITASQFARTVEVEPAPVRLRVQSPSLVVGQALRVPVRVRATVSGVGLQALARVRVNGEVAESVELDQFGRGTFDAAGSLDSGQNEVVVSIPAGRYRDSAAETVRIRASREVEAHAEFREVIERLQRGVAVEGEVSDASGPIAGARVSVVIQRQGSAGVDGAEGADPIADARKDKRAPYERFVTTDAAGRFSAFFAEDDIEGGTWLAETTLVPDAGEEVSIPTEPLEIDRTTSRWVLNALGMLGLLGGLLLVLQRLRSVIAAYLQRRRQGRDAEERSRRAFAEDHELEPHKLGEGEAVLSREAGRDSISGVLWDTWRDRPIRTASLTLRAEDGGGEQPHHIEPGSALRPGAFVIEGLDQGAYELVVRAEGFVTGRMSLRIPHRGKLHNIRLDLVAVPLKVRRLYQSLVESLEGEDLWGRLSPRQIEETLVAVERDHELPQGTRAGRDFVDRIRARLQEADTALSGDDLVALMTAVVEETYFSGRTFDESVWQLARDIAVRLRARFEEARL